MLLNQYRKTEIFCFVLFPSPDAVTPDEQI